MTTLDTSLLGNMVNKKKNEFTREIVIREEGTSS